MTALRAIGTRKVGDTPLGWQRDTRLETVRLEGLPPGTQVRGRSAANRFRVVETWAKVDGRATLEVPLGAALEIGFWPPSSRLPLRIDIGRVGRLGATLAPTMVGTRPRPLAISRRESGDDAPGVTTLRLPTDVLRPGIGSTTPPLEPGRFRTPPATVTRGRIVQPPLAAGLDPGRAVIVIGDGVSDEAHYETKLMQPPGTAWTAGIEHAWATSPNAAAGRYVVAVTAPDEPIVAGFDGGVRRPGLYERTVAVLGEVRRPGQLVLAVGAADFRRGTPAAKVERELRSALDLVRSVSPGTRITLTGFTFPSDYGVPEDRARRISEYRSMYASVADAATAADVQAGRNARVVCIRDLFEGMLDRDGRLDRSFRQGKDTLHPNAAGQARLRSIMEQILSGNVPGATRTSSGSRNTAAER